MTAFRRNGIALINCLQSAGDNEMITGIWNGTMPVSVCDLIGSGVVIC